MATGRDLPNGAFFAEVARKLDDWLAQLGEIVPRPPPPTNILTHTSREAPEDIDAVEICPAYPDFMVVATWNSVRRDEDREYASQMRKGMIIVMPVNAIFEQTYRGEQPPACTILRFPYAIPDIHFHPSEPTLLGAATSKGRILFYHIIKKRDVLYARNEVQLRLIGSILVAPREEATGITPCITHFEWIGDTCVWQPSYAPGEFQTVRLIATDEMGNVRYAECRLPRIKDGFDPRLATPQIIPVLLCHTYAHDNPYMTIAAWTATGGLIDKRQHPDKYLFISGGDDGDMAGVEVQLSRIGQNVSFVNNQDVNKVSVMKKWHKYGVTAILTLEPLLTDWDTLVLADGGHCMLPILSGSYDGNLRLWYYDPIAKRNKLVWEQLMPGGGVWRIKLMDTYTEESVIYDRVWPSDTVSESDSQRTERQVNYTTRPYELEHYVLLLTCMYRGAVIVRLIWHPQWQNLLDSYPKITQIRKDKGWTVIIEAQFQQGHESVCYAADFRKEHERAYALVHPDLDPRRSFDSTSLSSGEVEARTNMVWAGDYTCVSTSMYDRKICVWKWRDEVMHGIALAAHKSQFPRLVPDIFPVNQQRISTIVTIPGDAVVAGPSGTQGTVTDEDNVASDTNEVGTGSLLRRALSVRSRSGRPEGQKRFSILGLVSQVVRRATVKLAVLGGGKKKIEKGKGKEVAGEVEEEGDGVVAGGDERAIVTRRRRMSMLW